jgi:hypothetical protein
MEVVNQFISQKNILHKNFILLKAILFHGCNGLLGLQKSETVRQAAESSH